MHIKPFEPNGFSLSYHLDESMCGSRKFCQRGSNFDNVFFFFFFFFFLNDEESAV